MATKKKAPKSETVNLTLADLIPEKETFTLSKMKKTYTLRMFNLIDRVWLKKQFGSQKEIERVFNYTDPDWGAITRVVYHQMVDKSDFLASEESVIDDNGFVEKRFVTGPEKLWAKVADLKEGFSLISALVQASILSEPMIKDKVEGMLSKKKLMIPTGE